MVASPAPASPRTAAELLDRLAAGGPAAVALSAGVDSGLVASLAREALGSRVVGVTVAGPAVSSSEVDEARALARALSVEHVVLSADPLEVEAYRANGPDRCYHCRTVEGGVVRRYALERGFAQLLDGVHRDDLGDDRPGIRAMDEAGFFHPLLWAGWGKAEVRRAAHERRLPNWDRPSNACLSSRVARGMAITPELLRRVEASEAVLRARGFRRVRVRVDGQGARIEVDPTELGRLLEPRGAEEVRARLLALGFASVRIDPRGYQGRDASLPVIR